MKLNKIIASAIMGGLVATAIAIADDHGTATTTTAPADTGTAAIQNTAAPKVVAKKTKKKKKAVQKVKVDAAAHTEGHTDTPAAHTEEQKPAAH